MTPPFTISSSILGLPDHFRQSPMDAFVALDFETATREPDSACAVGMVRVEKGQVVAREVALVRPPKQEFVFTYLHGIAWEQVADKGTFADVWPVLRPLLDGVSFLSAHNVPFDSRVLAACCKTHNLPVPELPWRCTLEMSRNRWRGQKNDLAAVCSRLGLTLNHHEAGSDAEACARVLLVLSGG